MTSKFRAIAPYFFLILVALYSVWPVVANIKNSLPLGHEDIMITWIIGNHIQKIPNDLLNFFNGNIFFPYKNTLAYSEPFSTSAIISYIPVKLTGNYLLGFNLSLIVGQILTMIFLYSWLTDITKSRMAALLGTLVFTLSQIRMHYFVHIQMWNLEWFIASLWLIWKFTKEGKIWQLYLAAFFVVLQIWESILPVFWIIFFAVTIFALNFKKLKKYLKHFVIIALIIFLASFPVIRAYLRVSSDFNFQRSIRDAAHFSMNVNDIWEIYLSPGLYLLGVFALLKLTKKELRKNGDLVYFLLITVYGLIMSLGPVLKWRAATIKLFERIFIPLPYGIFYYLVPSFGALRTPSRWMILFALGLSGIIAIKFSKVKTNYKIHLLALAFLLAIFAGTKITKVVSIPSQENYPAVYKWLEGQMGDAILELPIYTSGDGSNYTQEFYRMLFSLYHRKNLVNGASGFDPPPWGKLVKDIHEQFPNTALEERLSAMGVDFIIVHKDQYDQKKLNEIATWGEKKVIYEDKSTLVFKL